MLFTLIRSNCLLLVLLLGFSNALAQKQYSYTPAGPVTLLSGNGSQVSQIVTITNETNQQLFLRVKFRGDTTLNHGYHIWGYYTEDFYIGPDSSMNFNVTYRAWPGDTSYAFMRIYDSVSAPDTIWFAGMDTTAPNLGVGNYPHLAGSAFGRDDTARVIVYNLSPSTVTVTGTLVQPGSGFTGLPQQTQTIAPSNYALFKYLFNSSMHDTAYAAVRFTVGGAILDTAALLGMNAMPTDDSLEFYYGSLDSVNSGDTLCTEVVIVNNMDSAAVIKLPSNYIDYYEIQPHINWPEVLYPGDSLVFSICIRAVDTNLVHSADYNFEYYFPRTLPKYKTLGFSTVVRRCLTMTGPASFGRVREGDTVVKAIRLTNSRPYDVTLFSFAMRWPSAYTPLATFPVVIPANSSVDIDFQFVADKDKNNSTYLIAYTDCGQYMGSLEATVDTLIAGQIPLFDSVTTLDFVADTSITWHIFQFVNDLQDSITLLSVSLAQGMHLEITQIWPNLQMPFMLGPSDILRVTVSFTGTPGFYEDTLIIVTETGIVALRFPIEIRAAGQDVSDHGFGAPRMSISPNPSSGPVQIRVEDAWTAEIVVLDLMGKPVAKFSGVDVRWDRGTLPAGTYFIRASGEGEDRKPFVITQRVVIE